MVFIPGLGGSSFPGGLAGIPGADGATGPAGADGQNGYGPSTAGGRLTTVSNTPILTSNQLAKTTLYYTPFKDNQLAVYTGSTWVVLTFPETPLSLSGYTANKNYDIWGYSNNGTLALDSTVWTNDTTRATALTTQDGVQVKTGDTTRRYLGTVRINSTGGQIDWVVGANAEVKFTIWNENNRVPTRYFCLDGTNSWTHGNDGAWSAPSTALKVSFVLGRLIEPISAEVNNKPTEPASTNGAVAIGLDATNAPASNQQIGYNNPASTGTEIRAKWVGLPSAAGQHYVQYIDFSTGGTSTFYGDNNVSYLQTGLFFEGYF